MKKRIAILGPIIGLIFQASAFAEVWPTPRVPGGLPSLISFSHRYHIDEVGATCLDCHPTYKKPTMEICSQCHEGTGPEMTVVECMKCHLRLDFGGIAPKPTFLTSGTSLYKRADGVCDRTIQVKNELAAKLKKTCEQITDVDLLTVTQLDLSAKEIRKLNANDFQGLSNLENLSLENNKLRKLPEGIFAGLGKLKFLSVGHNKIRSLEAKIFQGLGRLDTLFLAEMKLKKLPPGLFSGLVNLENLNLRFNRLSKFKTGELTGLPALKRLFLEYNSLKKLPVDFIKGFTKLEWIFLSNNSLRELPPGLFVDIKSLTSVRLGSNRFNAKELERIKKELGGVNPTATIWTEL
ncbi:MAG: hypothetical protein A2X86_00140 [Bdellovibrionales bacterium GWA2_49_15]|nr:MAG: hypothetical protein A2X86_00140 [Bdellovibrionales bacterium GWA2_49_15]HAZ14451.1 hypothetical protein [Bdellovibrionales bacterium]